MIKFYPSLSQQLSVRFTAGAGKIVQARDDQRFTGTALILQGTGNR
jgi:hypothetical protein